jgi:hypothetical protein
MRTTMSDDLPSVGDLFMDPEGRTWVIKQKVDVGDDTVFLSWPVDNLVREARRGFVSKQVRKGRALYLAHELAEQTGAPIEWTERWT